MGREIMERRWLCVALVVCVAGGASQAGEVSMLGEDNEEMSAVAAARLKYRDTLQHISDKYCSSFKHKVGQGAVFCSQMESLQYKWAEAEELGETTGFMALLGSVQGHYCADKEAQAWSRCKVFKLMVAAAPVKMKWSPERKKFLQLNKDVSKHYCKIHGEKDIFCPLTKGLAQHYYEAVNAKDTKKYTSFTNSLKKHYCSKKAMAHPADDRCSIFALLKKGTPANFGLITMAR